ncbi:hypothetical protein GHK33_20240 [Sinorhizobium meliloti]|uniref:hypothetical protein n=1 Tax=Rhizobium meliloti TaxID=382 RepID=UPI001295128F|nr:hypothetical protein [Sinorhizobium meliloti]MQW64881.1 hypothetical protein [Sinorhizobium meliloti]
MTKLNPMSHDYFTTLNNRWMSIIDLRSSLQRAKALRTQQANLIARLEGQIAATKQSLDASTKFLTSSERLTVSSRAVTAKRKELVESSRTERHKLVTDINVEFEAIMDSDLHYQSAVQVLMRSSIGKDRRTLIAGQIEHAGPAELLSLAHLAAATGDQEMGAALVTRVSTLPASGRPFSSQSLASALVGATFEEAQLIFGEIEAIIVEALAADKTFETGKTDALGKIKAALLKRRNDAHKDRLDAANGIEPEHRDRTLVLLDDGKPAPGAGVTGTTLPDGGGVRETPAGAEARSEG